MVIDGETCTMRMRPRTWSWTEVECVSRMHTAALSAFPEPRRMASRPVDSMAETMVLGAAVPVMEINCALRSAETESGRSPKDLLAFRALIA